MTPLLDIVLVFLLGGAIGLLSLRYRFPNAVAQVILGVILGTAVLGWVPHSPALHDLGEVGVVLLLGLAGLELGLDRLKAAGWTGAFVALLGIAFSVGGGYAVGDSFGSASDEAIYLGLALGATSIGITVQVLEQFNLIGHRVADVIIAAAVIDDIVVLYLLGVAHGFLGGDSSAPGALGFVLLAIAAIAGLYWISRKLTDLAFHHRLIVNPLTRSLWIITAIALGAVLTHALGMSLVVGAFFAGVGVAGGLPEKETVRSTAALRLLVLSFMPFFFVMIGVQVQWTSLQAPGSLWLLLSIVIVGLASKTLAGLFGALGVKEWRDRWLIGFGMVARGEVALMIVTLGLKQGHVTRPIFASIVFMAVIAAVLGPLFMTPLAKRTAAELPAGGPG